MCNEKLVLRSISSSSWFLSGDPTMWIAEGIEQKRQRTNFSLHRPFVNNCNICWNPIESELNCWEIVYSNWLLYIVESVVMTVTISSVSKKNRQRQPFYIIQFPSALDLMIRCRPLQFLCWFGESWAIHVHHPNGCKFISQENFADLSQQFNQLLHCYLFTTSLRVSLRAIETLSW